MIEHIKKNMIKVLVALLVLAIFGFAHFYDAPRAEADSPIVVLELFTSQGCSSCPPADRLLDEVKEEYPKEKVITLSYHVDYWNYIGWEDPFSSRRFTDRQRVYGSKFNDGNIYTPQLVINGKEHFVGSSGRKMKAGIKKYLANDAATQIEIESSVIDNGRVEFIYDVIGQKEELYVRAILVLEEKETFVETGENRKKTLKNTNIVIAQRQLSIDGRNGSIEIPDIANSNDKLRLVLVTESEDLDITGGTQRGL